MGLRHLVERTRLFEGQTVVVSVVLDTTGGSVDGFEWIQPPEYPGWWVQRVEMPDRVEASQVEVEGEVYNRFEIGRFVLIPLKTGRLTIPAASARIGFRGRSVFTPQSVIERSTGDLVVEVKERPATPAGFTGAVGDLRYSVSLEPSTIEFGASTVVAITLEGQGNLPLVQAPFEWPTCADCESYPPEEESSIAVDGDGVRGSRSWSTTLLPRSWGELTLEAVELAVFDPVAGGYRYRTLGPLQLQVAPPPPTPVPTPPPGVEPATAGNSSPQQDREPGPVAGTNGERGMSTWVLVAVALLAGARGGGRAGVADHPSASEPHPPQKAWSKPLRESTSPADGARALVAGPARLRPRGRSQGQDSGDPTAARRGAFCAR